MQIYVMHLLILLIFSTESDIETAYGYRNQLSLTSNVSEFEVCVVFINFISKHMFLNWKAYAVNPYEVHISLITVLSAFNVCILLEKISLGIMISDSL